MWDIFAGTDFNGGVLNPMAKQFITHIRAHAHVLIRIARKASDPIVLQELEGLASNC